MSLDYWKSAPYFLNFAESYQIGQRIKERLGRHEMPTALEVRDSLPHTPVGKLAKRELVDLHRASNPTKSMDRE